MAEPQRRVLVATEAEARLQVQIERLRATGAQVTVASPKESVRRLEQGQSFDLVIVEVESSDLGAFEVAREYRAASPADAPVLAVSGDLKRDHIEGMLENAGIRRLIALDAPVEEFLFWVNHALFPEASRSRRTPRLPAPFLLEVVGTAGNASGQAWNLSEEGVFLETTLEAKCGETLRVEFRLPDPADGERLFRANAEVVWASEGTSADGAPRGLGLRFLDLDEASRAAIKARVLAGLLEAAI